MDNPDSTVLEHFLCGGMGGIWSVLIGHPFDTVKVRLQTMPKPLPGHPPIYRGMIHCFQTTIKQEGPFGLYKGMLVPLLTVTPVFAVSFTGYHIGKEIFSYNNADMVYFHYFCAGAFTGLLTTTLMAPAERVKCMLQVQRERHKSDRKFQGPFHLLKAELSAGGIFRIYRGFFVTLMRELPGSGIYFLTYEFISAYETHGTFANLTKMLIGGGMAGLLMWIVVLPFDVIKSRVQTATASAQPGILHVLGELVRHHGISGLYSGFMPVMARAFPANAACFLGFEFCDRQIIQRYRNH